MKLSGWGWRGDNNNKVTYLGQLFLRGLCPLPPSRCYLLPAYGDRWTLLSTGCSIHYTGIERQVCAKDFYDLYEDCGAWLALGSCCCLVVHSPPHLLSSYSTKWRTDKRKYMRTHLYAYVIRWALARAPLEPPLFHTQKKNPTRKQKKNKPTSNTEGLDSWWELCTCDGSRKGKGPSSHKVGWGKFVFIANFLS